MSSVTPHPDRSRPAVAGSKATAVERVTHGRRHLMGYESSLGGIAPARAREEVQRSLLAFVEGWARQRPVVVLLSDLHWADDAVLELGDLLLEKLSSLPVVL